VIVRYTDRDVRHPANRGHTRYKDSRTGTRITVRVLVVLLLCCIRRSAPPATTDAGEHAVQGSISSSVDNIRAHSSEVECCERMLVAAKDGRDIRQNE